MDREPETADLGHLARRPVRLLVFGAFLLIFLAGVESAARFITRHSSNVPLQVLLQTYGRVVQGDEKSFRFTADDVLPYRLTPGFEMRGPDGRPLTRHNEAGFRDDVEYGPKDVDTLRIVCIGGSVTYGAGVRDNAATYPACLARWLNDVVKPAGWKRVEVFNLGVGGYTSEEDIVNLRTFGLPLKPDVVLVHSGVNDVAPRFYPDFRCDYGHFRKPMKPLTTNPVTRLLYRSRLVLVAGWKLGLIELPTLLSRTQHPLPPVDKALANLARNDTGCFREHLTSIVNLCRQAGVRVWLMSTPYLNAPDFQSPTEDMRRLDEAGYRKGLQEHNAVMREVAQNAAVGLVDLDRHMPSERQIFADPIHFSEQGNAVAAKLIAETIADSLIRTSFRASQASMNGDLTRN